MRFGEDIDAKLAGEIPLFEDDNGGGWLLLPRRCGCRPFGYKGFDFDTKRSREEVRETLTCLACGQQLYVHVTAFVDPDETDRPDLFEPEF